MMAKIAATSDPNRDAAAPNNVLTQLLAKFGRWRVR